MIATGYDARTASQIKTMTDSAERIIAEKVEFNLKHLKGDEQPREFAGVLYDSISKAVALWIRSNPMEDFANSQIWRERVKTEWMCRHVCENCGEEKGHGGSCE